MLKKTKKIILYKLQNFFIFFYLHHYLFKMTYNKPSYLHECDYK